MFPCRGVDVDEVNDRRVLIDKGQVTLGFLGSEQHAPVCVDFLAGAGAEVITGHAAEFRVDSQRKSYLGLTVDPGYPVRRHWGRGAARAGGAAGVRATSGPQSWSGVVLSGLACGETTTSRAVTRRWTWPRRMVAPLWVMLVWVA